MQRIFFASLYDMVSDSVHTVKCSIKCHTKRNYHNLQNYIQARFKNQHTLLHTRTIKHMKKIFPVCHMHQKYSTEINCHSIHNYTHEYFKLHSALLQVKK